MLYYTAGLQSILDKLPLHDDTLADIATLVKGSKDITIEGIETELLSFFV